MPRISRVLPPAIATALAVTFLLVIAPATTVAQQPPTTTTAPEALEHASADEQQLAAACGEIRDMIAEFIAANKRPAWDEMAPSPELDSADELLTKIKTLNHSETLDAFIRHCTEFLLRHPENPAFPRSLWQLASVVELSEHSPAPSMLRKAFFPVLIAACDRLPADNRYRIEAIFLSAEHLRREGLLDAEETLLRELISRDGLPLPLISTAQIQLGANLEAQGKFDDALDSYAASASTNATPKDCDIALRSALINLELGRPGAALELLRGIGEIDPHVVERAIAAPELAKLLPLAATAGALDNYWKQTNEWWPAWIALRRRLGDDRPEGDIRIPDLPSLRDSTQPLVSFLRHEDKTVFLDILDLIMHGLRWSPTGIAEAGTALCFLTPQAVPDLRQAVYEFTLSVCENFAPGDKQLERSAWFYQTICHSELGAPEKALATIETFRAADVSPDELSETMLRLWAHLAIAGHAELSGPLAGLEKLLDRAGEIASRPQSVLYLAQLYRKSKRFDDEAELLEREIGHPAIRADKQIATTLANRAKALAEGVGDTGEFAAAIADWRIEHAPGWLRFALPLGLDDPRVKDKDLVELVSRPSTARLTPEERVAVELLIAASEDVPISTRDRAFRAAFAGLHAECETHSQARAMLRDILRDDRFPKPLQQMLLIFSLDEALANGRKRGITNALTHPLLDRDDERIADAIQAYGRFASTDIDDSASLLACYRDLSKKGISPAGLTVIGEIFGRLLQIGDIDNAAQIQGDVADWDLHHGVGQEKGALLLAFTKALRRARGAAPFGRAMRDLLTGYEARGDLQLPANPGDFRDGINLKSLPEAQAFALLVKRGSDPITLQASPSFWIGLAELMPRDSAQVDFAFGLVKALLESRLPDLEKSFGIVSVPGIIDTDSPELLARLLELFKKYADADSEPNTYAMMRIVETQSRDLRQGKEIDLRNAWRGLVHPALARIQTSTTIRNLVARGKKALLRSALDAMLANELLSADMIDITWPALVMAGMDDEAELAKKVALEHLPAFATAAARQLNLGLIRMVFDTARRTGDPGLLPDGWFGYLDSQIKAERDRYSLHIIESEFREDWQSLAKWSMRAVEEFPTYYNYYRPLGVALHHLGRTAEAIAALETYTEYSKDEPTWRDAVTLLERLREVNRE